MNTVLSLLGRFGALAGILVIAYLIWSYGSYIPPLAPTKTRVIVIAVLVLGYVLVQVFKWWRNKKKSAEISKDLAEAAESADPNAEQSREEMAELRDRFDEALKTLKKSSVGGKKVKSIYQLPWYMIIGPPGSGKTTLLINSGLQFPLAEAMGESKVQGVGGTRYCDWWFTDEAVLIDTAGRYTTQDSNQEVDNTAWLSFLGLLKKHRRRRPINGIILAISLEELLRQSDVDRERNAKAVTERIQELYEELGVRFPVYLMFTKSDLMAGFMEFYGNLDRYERAQVWGFTYGVDDDILGRFDGEFDLLQSQLEARLVQRLQDERDVQRRELIYDFPLQLAATREAIEEFMQRVFKPSRYRETPFLRGVYLTSGTQEGTPFNRIMSQLASNFSLSRSATQSMPSHGKSYFIKDLMMKVIFGESGLAGANLKVERMYSIGRKVAWASMIALPLLLTGAWIMSYQSNKGVIADVELAAEGVTNSVQAVSGSDTSLRSILPLMDEARDMPLGYANRDESPPITQRWGLSVGPRLGEQGTIPAYDRVLENAFQTRLMVSLEKGLNNALADPDRVYELLKVYLMMSSPKNMDVDYVRDFFVREWDDTLARTMGSDQYTSLKGHLDALLDLAPLGQPIEPDANLIAQARLSLAGTSWADRIYQVIKSDHLKEGDPFTIVSMTDESQLGARVFILRSGKSITSGVPAFFSPPGYYDMYLEAEDEAIQRVQDEAWIYAQEADDANMLSETELKNQVRLLYLYDYANTWVRFLEDVRIMPFRDLAQAAEIIGIISGDPSPLTELLTNVAIATRINPDETVFGNDDNSIAQQIEDMLNTGSGADGVIGPERVDQAFARLHSLTQGRGDAPPPLAGLITDLGELYSYLQQLSMGGGGALGTEMQRLATSSVNKVRAKGQQMPDPVRAWVTDVADQSDSQISQDFTKSIQQAWTAEIVPFCQQAINGRYPFVPNATDEVQIADFGAFFGQGGRLDQFINNRLMPIMDVGPSSLRLKPEMADKVQISNSSLRALQAARNIKNAFFPLGGLAPAVSFTLTPTLLDAQSHLFTLNVNGQVTRYDHGPRNATNFNWPGQGANQVYFEFSPTPAGGGRLSRVGPWAWFRVLDETGGLKRGSAQESFIARFELADRYAEYELGAGSAFNPFDMDELRTFRCPNRL